MIKFNVIISMRINYIVFQVTRLDGMKNAKVTDHIRWLARGPHNIGRRFKGYIINGIRFHTKDREVRRKTQNSGVVISTKTSTSVEDVHYYGVLNDIIELNYFEMFRVVLFKCNWVDVERGKGIKKDQLGFTLVNLSKLVHTGENSSDEPFVFASQVQQVFYVQDLWEPNWHVVVKTKPRDIYEMGDELLVASNNEQQVDNSGIGGEVTRIRNDINGKQVYPTKEDKDGSSSEELW